VVCRDLRNYREVSTLLNLLRFFHWLHPLWMISRICSEGHLQSVALKNHAAGHQMPCFAPADLPACLQFLLLGALASLVTIPFFAVLKSQASVVKRI
jgi:hypothetical protein